MTKEQYNLYLKAITARRADAEIKFFHDVPFLQHLSKHQANSLLQITSTLHTIKGQCLMEEGHPNKYLYIVREGEFRGLKSVVRKNDSEVENGYKKFLTG